jgi:hypothetical protein
MPDLPDPTVARLPRARWLDARLLLGILLVLGSVIVGARVVSSADHTVAVWSVTADLGPRVTLGAGDLRQRRVHVDGDQSTYLTVAAGSPVGLVVTRPLSRGELLPRTAVAPSGATEIRKVLVATDPLAAGVLHRGDAVDVYRVEEGGPGARPPAARLVLSRATVDRVHTGGKGLGGSGVGAGVVLVVDDSDVPTVLAAQAGARLDLVQIRPADEAAP